MTETEENLKFKMNLILLSNKWIDQKVRQGLAKIEKKAFGEKFFLPVSKRSKRSNGSMSEEKE